MLLITGLAGEPCGKRPSFVQRRATVFAGDLAKQNGARLNTPETRAELIEWKKSFKSKRNSHRCPT